MGTSTIFTSEIPQFPAGQPSAESEIHALVAEALRACKRHKPRAQVLHELHALLPSQSITTRNLEDWASPSKTNVRVPAWIIRPLAEVTGCHALCRFVLPDSLRRQLDIGQRVLALEPIVDSIRRDVQQLVKSRRVRKSKRARGRTR